MTHYKQELFEPQSIISSEELIKRNIKLKEEKPRKTKYDYYKEEQEHFFLSFITLLSIFLFYLFSFFQTGIERFNIFFSFLFGILIFIFFLIYKESIRKLKKLTTLEKI